MVVFRLYSQRVGSITFNLVAKRSDHLRMAGVTTLADVDVAPGDLERRIDAHLRCVLDRLMDGEQRRNFDDASHTRSGDDRQHEPGGLSFEAIVQPKHVRSFSRL